MKTLPRCPSCGKALGCKAAIYQERKRRVIDEYLKTNKISKKFERLVDLPPMETILDELWIKKRCCRTHMLSAVYIESYY